MFLDYKPNDLCQKYHRAITTKWVLEQQSLQAKA